MADQEVIRSLQRQATLIMQTVGLRKFRYPAGVKERIEQAFASFQASMFPMDNYEAWANKCIEILKDADSDMAKTIEAHLDAWEAACQTNFRRR